jgi:hypothetical protein
MCGPSTYWQSGSVLQLPHSWKWKNNSITNTVVLITATPIQTVTFHHKQDHSHSLVLISVKEASNLSTDMWHLGWNHVNHDKWFLQFPKSSITNAQILYQKGPDNFFPLGISKWWQSKLLSPGMWRYACERSTHISIGSCSLHHYGTLRMAAAGQSNRLHRTTSC